MFYKPLLLPMIALLTLTLAVWLYMYFTRIGEMNRKRIHPQQLKSAEKARALLTASAAPADNFRNLFEVPVLFYLSVLLALILMVQDPLLVTLSWAFVASRYLHSLIHCTYNKVMHRFIVYLTGCGLLILIWIRLIAFILAN